MRPPAVKRKRAQERTVEELPRRYGAGAGVIETAGLIRPRDDQPLNLLFARTLSLDRLIQYWEREAVSEHWATAQLARGILTRLEEAPELRGPIASHDVLERHRDLVDAMMTAVFPSALRNLAFSCAVLPGDLRAFYGTPRYRREMLAEDGSFRARVLEDDIELGRLLSIYSVLGVLRRVYGVDIPFEKSILLEIANESGLCRYYQIRAHLDFAEIRVNGTLPELSEGDLACLKLNVTDLDTWRRVLPESAFEFYGFIVQDIVDVTEEVCVSMLRQELVVKDPLGTGARIRRLGKLLSDLLQVPGLSLVMAALEGDRAILMTPCMDQLHLSTLAPDDDVTLPELIGGEACSCAARDTALLIGDLRSEGGDSRLVELLRRDGNRSTLIRPVGKDLEVQGVLAVASRQPGALQPMHSVKLTPVLAMFALALKRTLDTIQSKIQAVMKEQFTAIHPAIEWRFAEAALRFVTREDLGEGVEEIVFPVVYPLFGASDIRSSSTIRNHAIQADLLAQLDLAEQVLAAGYAQQALPYLDSLRLRVRKWIEEIRPGLHSGDETRIGEFLKHELEPLFARIQEFGPGVAEAAQRYRNQLDPRLGMLYQRRRRFEESVGEIRELITAVLYERQQEAQAFFPHYFEMHKSDGVDHTIYLGPSTAREGRFDPLFLRNLRLWQLLVMVEIARKTDEIVPQLPLPLETAHLILAQDTPLSIRFHVDEKQFNVDGAYNARYEIVKKRLDKAEVEGTGERLTQPGRVAVVYSHPREGAEYREYVEYLRDGGLIDPGVEELSVAPLQGVQGLKALRMTVVSGRSR